jgi:hypothetical protein
MGAGGGGVAMVEDGTAAWLNPAGLSRIRTPNLSVGVLAGQDRLREVPDLWWDTNRDGVLDERDPPLDWSVDVDDLAGLQVHLGRQIGGKFGVGFMAWFPLQRLYRLRTLEPALPHYVFHDNRTQRYSLALGVGGEIVRGVNIGASLDFHPRARFDLYGTVDARVSSPDDPDQGIEQLITEVGVDVHELELDLAYAARPVLGVQLEFGRWTEALDGLVLGASWRPAADVQVDAVLDIQGNVSIEEIGDLDPFVLGAALRADALLYDHYVPMRTGLGLAWRSEGVFSAYVDLIHEDWRQARLQITQLRDADATSPLVDLDDAFVDRNGYEVVLRSTWTFRSGLELRLPRQEIDSDLRYLQLTVRGGFAYVPTPLQAQGEGSAFLDNDRTSFTLGLGAEVWDPFELVDAPVHLDLVGQVHRVGRTTLPRQADVPTPGFPVQGSGIPIGGTMLVGGLEWGFDY